MSKFNGGMRACGVLMLWAAAAIATPAQTYITLHSFDGTGGALPEGGLIQGTDGSLYGTTSYGGGNSSYNYGTVYEITPSGVLTTLHDFIYCETDCTEGYAPFSGLIQSADGTFYGTTTGGGATGGACPYQGGCGTVFKIARTGALTTLYSFCSQGGSNCTDGIEAYAGLVQGTNGEFYGTTLEGASHGSGTVYKITASGRLTTLDNFCSQGGRNCTDGIGAYAGLIQGTNGEFYGTTQYGGSQGGGTVFKITASGRPTILHSFGGADGGGLHAGLVQGTDGKFYGTTEGGGAYGGGTVFSITAGGKLTTLYNFCRQGGTCRDGVSPTSPLVEGTDGNFYGTTSSGGFNKGGTIFKITPSGALTTLHLFCSEANCIDGQLPVGLVQDTNGDFYGTTFGGGTSADGTVFRFSVGLSPFVKAQPRYGAVGTVVTILGTKLTGATSVAFNGTAATFTVKSTSEITTLVPTGATSGTVQVITPNGTLSSNVPFTVTP